MNPEPGGEKKIDPAFLPVADDPGLPRVLLIGDSISIGYTLDVRRALNGKANVQRPPANCGPTIRGVEHLAAWLGEGRWDVIHFNFGLHDLKLMPDGRHQVPLEQYEANLRDITARLAATGARLIWASTTPVPEGNLTPPRNPADVVRYNAVAEKVVTQQNAAINDLHAFAAPKLRQIQMPANVHFTGEGSRILGEEVARVIANTLPK